MFREMRNRPIALSFITDNLKIHERTTYCNTEVQVFIIFIPRWITKRKREIEWINTGVNTRRRGGFMDINQRKLQLLPLNLDRCRWWGTRHILEFCGKTEKEFVVEDVENLKTINKIAPIAVNFNSSQGPSISGVVSRKMKSQCCKKYHDKFARTRL